VVRSKRTRITTCNRIASQDGWTQALCFDNKMPLIPKHTQWLKKIEDVAIDKKNNIEVYEFKYAHDDSILIGWAKHLRNHYCNDNEIDLLIEGTEFKTREDFLLSIKFPSTNGLGPSLRAGDFGEILVADFLEYILGYWVPRTRYDRKTIQDESTKGSDLTGFNIVGDGYSPQDSLVIFEVKTGLSGKKYSDTLQKAVEHSIKDDLRKAESLNAIKQRLIDRQEFDDAKKIARFQSPLDNPYQEESGGAALISDSHYDKNQIKFTDVSQHPHKDKLKLIVIYANEFMDLVHKLYERAANEA